MKTCGQISVTLLNQDLVSNGRAAFLFFVFFIGNFVSIFDAERMEVNEKMDLLN